MGISHRRVQHALLGLVITGAAGAALMAPGVRVASAQATLAPLTFTQQQADAGAAVYRSSCAGCHGANLQGAGAPALAGGAFKRCRDRPVGAFHAFISQNMPADNPGGLTDGQYISLVAFIARANGFAAGPTPLPGDAEALAAMGFRQ
jgi:alcohol dehydrogenase (cytochrome c)